MPCPALDYERPARDADHARDDPERRIRVGEPRPLLDVHLEEGVRQLAALDERAAPGAAALLVPEDGDRAAAGPLDRLDRGDDAKRAVEPPTVGNAVQM